MTIAFENIPKDLAGNLRFRKDLNDLARTDVGARKGIMEYCAFDTLFFLNAFAWVYEPRPRRIGGKLLPRQIPFIAWDHQVPAIQQIADNLGERDIVVEKSRGEGASWIGVLLATHNWIFLPHTAIGLVSKDERSVDDPDNPDSLFWKIDWELTKLPSWMAGNKKTDYKRDLTNHVLKNLRNGSTISGFAATGNVASGGRKTWFLMDELSKFPKPADKAAMASTMPVTDCRLIVSTPLGADGAYYEAVHGKNNALKLVLDWTQNPTRNRGLYEFKEGRPVAIDPINNPLPPEYDPPNAETLTLFSRLRSNGFILEGRFRSPWYDREADRAGATPQSIAQEYDRDYGGSSYRVFGASFITSFEETKRPFVHEGQIQFNAEKLEATFDKVIGGPLKLWMPLDYENRPPHRHYTLGADVSNGLGGAFTSSSTIVGVDMTTGEQVLEFASRTIMPQDFADYCIALAKWLNDAYLAWEYNGPGVGFTRRVEKQNYGNVYYRSSMDRNKVNKTRALGWWTSDETKRTMFNDLGQAVKEKKLILRSDELLKECGSYVWKDGKIHHALASVATDDSKGVSHGDRTIAACVCYQAMQDRPMKNDVDESKLDDAPPNTFAARHAAFLRTIENNDDGWVD